nr:f-box protein cpr30 [Quercus suber]
MSHLPVEIITEILSRLPVKSLLRFLCVSKSWYALIKHPDFIKLHLHRSIETNRDRTLIIGKLITGVPRYFFSVHFPTENHFDNAFKLHQPLYRRGKLVEILDYCHGLVCIHHWIDEIAIWNPLIRKYRMLSKEPILKPSGFTYSKSSKIGFGYDLCNDDYKVLRVTAFYNIGQPLKEFEVKVYSLRSHSWRKIEDQWPKKECSISSNSVSLNGALHWLIAENTYTPYDTDLTDFPRGAECLLAFDLGTEKFRVFKTPVQKEVGLVTRLEVLKGQLCFIVSADLGAESVWLMKEYGEASSWTQVYKIERGSVPWTFTYCKPLMFSENEKKVLLDMHQLFQTKLVWYEIEKKRCERVKIQNLPNWFCTAICVGSLLLLDGDNVIDPAEQKKKRKRNESPSEVPNPNLLGKQ